MVMTQALSKRRLTMTNSNYYIPDRQDLVWINFKPSVGQKIRGRHPAIVMSSANYSLVTGLVMVMSITHAQNNRLREFFIPLHSTSLDGYINPLQIFSFSIQKRDVQFTGEVATAQDWAEALAVHQDILGVEAEG